MADFFEKVKGGIDKGIKTVSSKSKEFLETTKLKGEIKDVETSIQSRFNALGKKVFEMLNRGALNEDELRLDCGEIASLYKKITELEEAIKKVELEALKMRYGADAIMCPKCNTPNKLGDKFCSSCGASLVVEVVSEGKTCPTCGASIKEGVKFCSKCGGKLEGLI
jgi:predicted nucleic acid-binding Zn ribbon protein